MQAHHDDEEEARQFAGDQHAQQQPQRPIGQRVQQVAQPDRAEPAECQKTCSTMVAYSETSVATTTIAVVLAAMATVCGSPASASRRSKAALRRVAVKIMKATMSVMALNPEVSTVRSWPLTCRKAPVLCSLNATGSAGMSAPKSQSQMRHEDEQQTKREAVARLLDEREAQHW